MIKTQIRIVTDTKELIYDVEMPVEEQEYADGLAHRDHIPEGTGMLYDFHTKPYGIICLRLKPALPLILFL